MQVVAKKSDGGIQHQGDKEQNTQCEDHHCLYKPCLHPVFEFRFLFLLDIPDPANSMTDHVQQGGGNEKEKDGAADRDPDITLQYPEIVNDVLQVPGSFLSESRRNLAE